MWSGFAGIALPLSQWDVLIFWEPFSGNHFHAASGNIGVQNPEFLVFGSGRKENA